MKAVAVSELKAGLSRFLAALKEGEEIIVTDRGKPVAKLVPVTRDETDRPPHLLALERAGMVKIGTGGLPDGSGTFHDRKTPRTAPWRHSCKNERNPGEILGRFRPYSPVQ